MSKRRQKCRPAVFVLVFVSVLLVLYLTFMLRFFKNSPTITATSAPETTIPQGWKQQHEQLVEIFEQTGPGKEKKRPKPVQKEEIHQEDSSPEDDELHMVFNTGCNLFQHWQAQALMASAFQVNQRGWITRIVSGCDYNDTTKATTVWTHPRGLSDQLVPLEELERSVFPRFRLHLTPTFEGAKEYPYLNKPQSLEHWVKHAEPKVTQPVIAILDPDFIFVSRLTVNGEGPVLSNGQTQHESYEVSKGHPVAQKYGIGSQWVQHASKVCPEDSPCTRVTTKEADQHYQVGAPYLLHKDDFAELMPWYTKFMKGYVKLKGPGILSDMYAYTMAAAHLELPHTVFDHYMVSCVDCRGEGWPWVNVKTHDACHQPYRLPNNNPVFLHYCHNYNNDNQDDPMFHKGHVPPNILDCDQPLILEAYGDYQVVQTTAHQMRAAWMVCMIIPRLNSALEHYKAKYCTDFDISKRFRLIHGQQSHNCGDEEGKTCWVYADKKEVDWQWKRTEGNYTYEGCFRDKEDRDFPNKESGVYGISSCWMKAKARGSTYFGVQYGGECYHGDRFGKHGKATDCDFPCTDGTGTCGGYYANSVYKT